MNFDASKIWLTVYEDDPTPADPTPADPTPGDSTFTQEQVNAFLKKEKDKDKSKYQIMIDELEAFKTKAGLSDEHRTDLETQIETYKQQLMTKEELAVRDKDKLVREHKGTIDTMSSELDGWKQRYTNSTITRSIQDSAIENKAFFPEQIVAMLSPNTTLVEGADDDGKPNGVLIPSVEFSDVDSKTGKPVTLTLSVNESVKRMKEIEKYFNLFQSDGSGGIGGRNTSKGKDVDLATLANDPAAYRKAKKEGKI